MRIAVCVTDRNEAEHLKKLIYSYTNSIRAESVVTVFSSGEALLSCNVAFHLILLECSLPGPGGMETALCLRGRGCRAALILLADHLELILQAQQIQPFRFLTKPLLQSDLFAALSDYFHSPSLLRPIWIKNGCETVCLPTHRILYLEADNKHCLVALAHKKIPCRKTMATVYDFLPKNRFCRINRTYIVNLDHISGMNKKTVRLTNGETLPVTKHYYEPFLLCYTAFADPIRV